MATISSSSQRIERTDHRQASDEFGNHSKGEQVFRFHMADGLLSQCFLHFERRAAKAHHFLADAFLNDFVESDECATANEKNFLGIDLDIFLMRMFAAALRWNVAHAAFQNFQERLLHSFAGNIACDAHVIGLAADLVDLVNVNDADLRSFHVVIGILKQSQNDVFDVFADVAGFGQRSRVGNAEWHVQDSGQRFGQQRLPGARWSNEQNVALLNLNVRKRVRLKSSGGVTWRCALQHALVVIVHSHR